MLSLEDELEGSLAAHAEEPQKRDSRTRPAEQFATSLTGSEQEAQQLIAELEAQVRRSEADKSSESAMGLAKLRGDLAALRKGLRQHRASMKNMLSSMALVEKLHTAAKEGDLGQVCACLGAGVEQSAKNTAGSTALMVAASGGHYQVVELLLRREEDPASAACGVTDYDGETAIGLTAASGHIAVFRLLYLAGANANVQVRMHQIGTLFGQLQEATEQAAEHASRAAMHIQATWRKKKLAEAASAAQMTPLMIAAKEGRLETVQLLLHRERDPAMAACSATDSEGNTAISHAAASAHVAVVELLWHAAADTNVNAATRMDQLFGQLASQKT